MVRVRLANMNFICIALGSGGGAGGGAGGGVGGGAGGGAGGVDQNKNCDLLI